MFVILPPVLSLVSFSPRLRSCLGALVVSAAAACPGLSHAMPDQPPVPPVGGQVTADRSLLEAAASKASPLVQQVRDKASDLVLSAMNFLGVPYRRGGTSAETGFDCSGFTRHVFENSIGLVLPRRADEQARAPGLLSVTRDELKPGDLVFFNTLRHTFSHVGIYIGEGKFIHSPRTGSEVRVEDMREAYWAKRFTGARRSPLADEATPSISAAPAAGAAQATMQTRAEAIVRSAVGNRPPAQ
jgi:hypothetical protein